MAYTDLITRVISDFDSIFSVLVNKKVKYGSGDTAELITVEEHRDTGKIQTNQYATLLGTLVHVDGLSTNDLIANNSNIKNIAANNSLSVTPDGTYEATVTIPAAAYYDTSSTLKTTVSTQGLTISEEIGKVTAVDNVYTFTADPEVGLFASVILKKGSVSVETTKTSINEANVTYTTSVTAGTITGVAASLNPDEYSTVVDGVTKSNAVALKFKTSVTRGGSFTITPTIDGSSGYLTTTDINTLKGQDGATFTFGDTNIPEDDKTTLAATFNQNAEQIIYIKEGGFALNSSDTSEAKASITGEAVWATDEEIASGENIIRLDATVGNVNLTGTFTEGYVKEGQSLSLGSITGLSGERYLKVGSLGTVTVDAGLEVTGNTGITISKEKATELGAGKYYSLTAAIPTANKTQAKTLTPGMISNANYEIGLTGEPAEIYIAKGSLTISPKATVQLASSSYVSSTATRFGFSVTPSVLNTTENPVIPADGFKAGYFESAPTVSIETNQTPVNYYIKEGTVTTTASFDAILTEVDGDGAGGKTVIKEGKEVIENIFEETTDNIEGDYYTITAKGISTVGEGYVNGDSVITANDTATRYLPKANITRQVEKGTDDDGNEIILRTYLEVTRGGYLPSGTIGEISTDGDIVEEVNRVYAAVKATIDTVNTSVIGDGQNAKNIFSSTVIPDGYKLSVKKSSKFSAGYISGTEGQGTLTGDFWIAKGSTTATTSFTPDQTLETTKPVLTAVETGEGENKKVTGYSLTVAGTHTTTIATGEGYITASEVTLKDADGEVVTQGNVITTDVSQTVVFDKANVIADENAQAISLGITVPNIIQTVEKEEGATADPSKYVITPNLTGESSIVVHAEQDGYVKSTDEFTINILADGSKEAATPIYIKEGTGGDIVVNEASDIAAAEKLAIRTDFSEAKGDATNGFYYEVSAAGKLATKVELAEGYYGEIEKTITSATPVDLGTIKIDKAVGKANLEGSIGISSDNGSIQFVETTPANGEGVQYVTVKAAATVTGSVAISKAGYIKNGEILDVTNVADDKGVYPVKAGEAKIALFTDVGTTTTPKLIGQTTGDLVEDTGLILETEHKYVQSNITVALRPNAMGSDVIDYLTQLSARLDGSLSRETSSI